MKTLSTLIIILFLLSVNGFGQSKAISDATFLESLQKKKTNTDKFEFKHQKQLLVFVKLSNKAKLVRITGADYPDNTDYIYTIIEDPMRRITAIEQVPYSESGDWYEEFKHYFDLRGNTFAFSIRTTVFDDSVKGGVAMWQLLNYYKPALNLLNHTTFLTDSKDNPLKGRKDTEFDFRHDPYHTYKSVDDCLKAYHIDKSML